MLNRRLMTFAVWLPFVASALALPSMAETTVTGDGSLLKQLRNGISTAYVDYPSGELVCRIQEGRPGHDGTDAHVRLVWSGERRYWKYTREYHTIHAKNQKGPGEIEHQEAQKDVEAILAKGRYYTFRADLSRNGFLLDIPAPKKLRMCLRVHPQDLWYQAMMGRRTWAEYLDPIAISEHVESIDVRREGDLVHVERNWKNEAAGAAMEITFSLRQGGNVIKYASRANDDGIASFDGYIHLGEYEWAPVDGNRWRLQRMSLETRKPESPDETARYLKIDVESFDPSPNIPRNQFTLAALPLKDGTFTRRKNGKGKPSDEWYHGAGRAVGGIPADRLKALAEKLKQQKFIDAEN